MSHAFSQALICHPARPCPARLNGIDTQICRDKHGGLTLRYRVYGSPDAMLLPLAAQGPCPATAGPSDGLWQHTCCELFVAPANSSIYAEFNFSPSGQWANYRFTDYREREASFPKSAPIIAPSIICQTLADGFQLDVRVKAPVFPATPAQSSVWEIGLSVVIESPGGEMSYWALAHCAAQPDFHQRQSFSLTLPAISS